MVVIKVVTMTSGHVYLGDELIVLGQVCPTVDTAVCPVAPGQVAAEGLGRETRCGWHWLTAGHDRLQGNALSRWGSWRRAAPTQAVASEATKQVG